MIISLFIGEFMFCVYKGVRMFNFSVVMFKDEYCFFLWSIYIKLMKNMNESGYSKRVIVINGYLGFIFLRKGC